ncbi:MAG: SDR family oxidoreductase [Tetrasphaera sp.]|uniref:SDR family NAD(P)-dependent oxidoreductase n=1 Tax=Phycicoccus elongatus TaxID=101689 RepID=UPI001D78AEC9|nr:SDR family oxidoreductase [Tetrasphaera sp.]MCB9407087.1 SDR family oxidoreductase [Tetrasphaera sp.]
MLASLKKAPGSHIINTSSLFGLIAPPGQSAYCTGKFGLRGFSESIAGELEDDGIGVTTVHPGGINTRIATSGRRSERTSQGDAEAGLAIAAKALRMPPPRRPRGSSSTPPVAGSPASSWAPTPSCST